MNDKVNLKELSLGRKLALTGLFMFAILLLLLLIKLESYIVANPGPTSEVYHEVTLESGVYYVINGFEVVNKSDKIVKVTFNNTDGNTVAINVSYGVRVDGYFTLKDENTLFEESVMTFTEPYLIRFDEKTDYAIRLALNN